jgi:hypothetical protein
MKCDAAFFRVEMASGTSWPRNFLAIRPSFSDGYADKDIEMTIADLMEWGKTTDLAEGYSMTGNRIRGWVTVTC